MAKSKKKRALTPEELRELEEFERDYRKLVKKVNGIRGAKKTSKRYSVPRGLAIRLKAAAVTLVAAMGMIVGLSQHTQAANAEVERDIYTLANIVLTDEEQIPKIEIDGQEFELDINSIAIVDGEIEEGDNKVFAYDQEGNLLEGNVSGENLKGSMEISGQDLQEYAIYQVISTEGTQLIKTGEEISNVLYGDFVLGKEQHEEFVDVLYPSGDKILKGKIDEKSLSLVNEVYTDRYQDAGVTKMVVDTSIDEYTELNFRTSTNLEKYSIMMQIPNGTIIEATGETSNENGIEWTKIKYQGQEGWVATKYLQEFMNSQEQPQEKLEEDLYKEEQETEVKQENIQQENTISEDIRNRSGMVTGIDVSTMTPNQLRQTLESGISRNVSTDHQGNINTQAVQGDINFVHIKLGASPYGNGEFKPLDYNYYEELVKVCEELQVPYGFYYYSTAVNIDEAKIEADYIEQTIEGLREKYDMEYNILPMTIDVELANEKDRQYGEDIKDLTDAKTYIINIIQKDGISDNVLLYVPGRIIDKNDSDRLLDLNRLKENLTNPEDLAVWLCAPVNRDGETTRSSAKYVDMIENQYGFKVVNTQIVLDAHTQNGGRIDINNMDFEYFNEITEEKQNDVEVEATIDEDEER